MRLNDLAPAPGAKKDRKVVGRGIGSGHGKTATKGHKGQKARSGGVKGASFQGGQMPLQRTAPKRGFNNYIFAKVYTIVNLGMLNKLPSGTVVNEEFLVNEGIIRKVEKSGIKILGNGSIENSITVIANAFSDSAKEKIAAAGGKIEVI